MSETEKTTTVNLDDFWANGQPLGPPPPSVIKEVGRAVRENLIVHIVTERICDNRVDAVARRQQIVSWACLHLGKFMGKVRITFGPVVRNIKTRGEVNGQRNPG